MKDFKFRDNNFDLIRLLAAFQVAIVHMQNHLHLNISEKVIHFLGIFPGVPIFFVVSGFLISASWERNSDIISYSKNRFLRIYPALWIALLVSIFSVYFFYEIDFNSKKFWIWVVGQSTFVQFYNPDFLRGYGVGVLNGSLWTIPVELQFYFCLPLIYSFLKNQYTKKILIFIFLSIILSQVYDSLNVFESLLIHKLFGVTVFPYLYMFLTGVLIQKNIFFIKRYLQNKFYFWLMEYMLLSLIFSWFGFKNTGNHINPILSINLALIIISFAYSCSGLSKKLLKDFDISYGIYIYHMVFVNILVSIGSVKTIYSMFVCCLLTFSAAIISWKYIEKPSLILKSFSIKNAKSSIRIASQL